jgi:hypothetical protein
MGKHRPLLSDVAMTDASCFIHRIYYDKMLPIPSIAGILRSEE